MRALILLVAVNGCGEAFQATSGFTVSDIAGDAAPGVVGTDVSVAGTSVSWQVAANTGDVLRFVRPSGTFSDYDGVGLFEGSALTPAEKGIPILSPVATVTVTSAAPGTLTIDNPVAALPGDLVFVGDGLPPGLDLADGDAARAVSGAPGAVFSRIMVDPAGNRNVPHYRAIDIASDNRIRPGESLFSQHRFAIPAGCLDAAVHATVLYRPWPLGLANERGWQPRDYVANYQSKAITLLP